LNFGQPQNKVLHTSKYQQHVVYISNEGYNSDIDAKNYGLKWTQNSKYVTIGTFGHNSGDIVWNIYTFP